MLSDRNHPVAGRHPVTYGWQPTAENINALPESLRVYIHALETDCDPAGTIRELVIARDALKAMEARVAELEQEEERDAVSMLTLTRMLDIAEAERETLRARVQVLEANIEAFNRNDHDREGAAVVWCECYEEARARVQVLEQALAEANESFGNSSLAELEEADRLRMHVQVLKAQLEQARIIVRTMGEFATTRPSPQQTRQKSAREMVELFARDLNAILAPPAEPEPRP
jgi:CII-binding regulator of phage lambda lysogenization HflD